jgi:hypothetical protein
VSFKRPKGQKEGNMKYYITTGSKGVQYTLRGVEIKANGREWDYHIKNLGEDLELAKKKGEEYAGFPLTVRSKKTNARKDPKKIDHHILVHGKYKGSSVEEVAKFDPKWLDFIIHNCSLKRQQRAIILENPDYKAYLQTEIDRKAEQERKDLERKEHYEKIRQIRRDTSKHVGVIGERQQFTGTVENVRSGVGQYGVWYLTTIITPEGNTLQYWNQIWEKVKGAMGDISADKGDKVTFMAKVKDHTSYDGVAITLLSRATKAKVFKAE